MQWLLSTLWCTLCIFRKWTPPGMTFQVYGILNLLLLNQSADSDSALILLPLRNILRVLCYQIASWTKAAKTAVPVQTWQSDYSICEGLLRAHCHFEPLTVSLYIFICLMPEQIWQFIDLLDGLLVGYPTQLNDNCFTSCLLKSTQRRLLAAAEGTRVDTADLCYSKRNIWPCLFSEIDPTLCFEFIRKYFSGHPVCSC